MKGAPPELPGSKTVESPIDRALSLALAGEREAALRWAAGIVQSDPTAPSGLLLAGRLLAEFSRNEVAREAFEVCIGRAIDAGILPLAVAACSDLRRLGQDSDKHLDDIADAFSKQSTRLGDGSAPPPPLRSADDFHPLPSVLTGMALLNKATSIVRDARKAWQEAEDDVVPMVSPQPLFSSIGREGLRHMMEVFEVQTVPKGERVIVQGEEGAEAYIVARGELEVVREQDEGEPLVLARLNNGALFGEMALLSRAPRAASVIACKPSIVLMARKEDLDRVASEQPEVGVELAAYTRKRMVQNLGRTSRVLASVDPEERTALVERFVTRTYEKGENLVVEGEAAKGLHLIASGEVAVVRQDGDETLVIATLTPGDTIGEVSLVLRRTAAADVVAVHPTITLFLPREDFLDLIQHHPLLLAQLYHLAVHRDDETSSIVAQDALLADGDDFVLL